MESVSFASVMTLWQATSTTYVKSEHPDHFFADTYYGTASVRGADRVKENHVIYCYNWTKITYDVQGDKYSTTANSYGKDNTNQVVREITVKDKWNYGTKTGVYYDYSESTLGSYFSFRSALSDDKNEIIRSGQLIDNKSIIENVEILNEGKDILKNK
ncbi:hypothetical protein [Helcococcus ovis]|uniref:hypothetical protein n=1 Tax=Helcococcus ovis TaxID=72026 RepID=UPI0038BBC496